MILLDANLLVYAYSRNSPYHDESAGWVEEQMAGSERIGLPWPSILSFVRLMTNPAVSQPAVSPTEAWEAVNEWLDSPVVWIPQPTERHAGILGPLMKYVSRPNHVADAHLAALAFEHNLTLYTNDGGFTRFPGLRWRNPLQP